ncbi:MAG: hypothetical protein JWO08_573 [Verrucomicrobiaceae bacterium]|nr:hypothetical protein [Verrucomicrobiaceae bacterium]
MQGLTSRGSLKSSRPLSYLLEDLQDTPVVRAEVAHFLASSEGRPCPPELWLKRMQHWWTDNPAAPSHAARGWALRSEGRLVGFMACIPSLMAWQGQPVPAGFPVSWRVAAEHRSGSLPMLVKMRGLGRKMPLLDTTPNKQVQEMLDKLGFRSVHQRHGHIFVLGPLLGKLLGRGRSFPRLATGQRLITDPAQVTAIAKPYMSADRLESWTTPEFLRWRLASPLIKLRFIGAVDADGVLSSYLILAEHVLKGQPAWLMVDWFTTGDSIEEVLALIGELSRQPALFGHPTRRLLEAAIFPPEQESWSTAPSLMTLHRPASYYYLTPPSFEQCVKRCVVADGDYGM